MFDEALMKVESIMRFGLPTTDLPSHPFVVANVYVEEGVVKINGALFCCLLDYTSGVSQGHPPLGGVKPIVSMAKLATSAIIQGKEV